MALERFEAFYREGTPPWDTGRPQPVIVRLANDDLVAGNVLDAGCGTGENALFLAGRGFDVTGVDISPTAIARARDKATERGLRATFRVGDVRLPADLEGPYRTVIDSGVFHVFDDADQARYVASLAQVLEPGGTFHMVVFSDREPGDWGPRRLGERQIRAAFGAGWHLDRLERTHFDVLIAETGRVEAWHAAVRRVGADA
ncbi:MAG: class I SAM-dependent methyltransferase [Candidatus Sericytochromatia bacterium]|nr:class I SAM-dependent methyltransferase [Candidatus Tanganyikabacteria bacterium]